RNFFSGDSALSIAVSSEIDDISKVAASQTGVEGDGEIARQLADLQNALLMNGTQSTFNQYYTAQVTQLGLQTAKAEANAKDRDLIATAMDDQRQSVSGVSLNEEAAEMVKYQKAFDAASRIMTVIDDMLDTIINSMGRAGR
ncbi:MAG: hypothetical protein GYA17_03300, partial [Chloroflexi bacterium]|nr:hypothetical protein [Chloroflexota bacterium]